MTVPALLFFITPRELFITNGDKKATCSFPSTALAYQDILDFSQLETLLSDFFIRHHVKGEALFLIDSALCYTQDISLADSAFEKEKEKFILTLPFESSQALVVYGQKKDTVSFIGINKQLLFVIQHAWEHQGGRVKGAIPASVVKVSDDTTVTSSQIVRMFSFFHLVERYDFLQSMLHLDTFSENTDRSRFFRGKLLFIIISIAIVTVGAFLGIWFGFVQK